MAELTVDMTYGTALYEAAAELGKAEQIAGEAEEVLAVLEQEPDLRAFVDFPTISAEEKKSVLRNVFGGQIAEELMNFMFVLIDKRRMGQFERIIRVYKDLLNHEEGVAYGVVYSAVPLDEKRLAEIEEQTSRLLRENIKLDNETDPSLIAGIKVMVEGKIIDASVRRKFDELASQMNISQGRN
ncbi:MAG: ATP synthase F1 subunit delta [Firmicutes bacterium]|nr:ATP synthase F1 subunit delta [Bacillota bacterium]MBQ9016528.1 ATP synthase F1 subunit delta [Bacillota bacterium]